MKKIGMMVAVEMDAVFAVFGQPKETKEVYGFKTYIYDVEDKEVYAIHSGAGQISASAATMLLIAVYQVEAVFNFGVVGGLVPEMALAKTCVVEKVVHYDYDTSACDHCEVGRYLDYPSIYIPTTTDLREKAQSISPDLMAVTCASGDKFVDDQTQKENLVKQFNAQICEMEAAAIALTCNRCQVPCLMIKTVSDALSGGANSFWENLQETSKLCLETMKKIIIEL